ncbi:MAG: SusC/RagA family TonB-linked outer membrane protein [Bacteroidetes bacterium]|nr:SusC/RagA family TonB-linked outer membrane protein [Bacteroidota bacterium]
MKLTTLLMTLALLTASAAGYSQITLKEKNVPLEKALSDIEKQTKYVFLYDAGDLKSAPVTVDVTNVTLEEALKQCLAGLNIEFTVEDHNVLLRSKPPAAVPPATKKEVGLIDVHGRVVDENGLSLPGATVKIKDGTNSTSTDAQGQFYLRQVDPEAMLAISFIGYESLTIKAKPDLGTITLRQQHSKLDEVQVIAYGTTTARFNTGDVTSIKASDIENQPLSNPLLTLQGMVPGLFITQTTGVPGQAAVQSQIRGINNFLGSGDPLYVIDGVPFMPSMSFATFGGGDGTQFNFINPNDIESISVLKDADATAIYGSRGANGVILITTKKGKAGDTQVDLNIQSGFGQVGHDIPVLNTAEYLQMRHEALANDNLTPGAGDYDLTLWDTTRNTDWQKVLIGGKAYQTTTNVSISGGNSSIQYLIRANYNYEGTVFPGNSNDQRQGVHFNISNTSRNQKFKIMLTGEYVLDENLAVPQDFTQLAIQLPPDAPTPSNADGSLNWAPNSAGNGTWPGSQALNPFAYITTKDLAKTQNLISNGSLSYVIIPGLVIKSSLGFTNTGQNSVKTIPLTLFDPSTWTTHQRTSEFANGNSQSWIVEPQLTFTRDIAKGDLSALIGGTVEQQMENGQVLQATGFSSDLVMQDINSATAITSFPTSNSVYRYTAIFGRLNYNWQDKYLIDITGRRDGSSRFGPQNRFANFYAVGAGWIFSKEKTVQQLMPFLSYGKLRASYGTTGSDQVGDYTYMDLYSPLSSAGVVPYQGVTGIYPTKIYTPNLGWELNKKTEVGLELGFFKDRVLLNTSFYLNRSTNQLVNYTLPSITGFTSIQENIPALIQNRGWEMSLSSINLSSAKLQWKTSINFTVNRNLLLKGALGLSPYFEQIIGDEVGSRLVYQSMGVNPFTGLYQFLTKQGTITSNPNPQTDQTFLIDPNQRFYGGIQNSVRYKNFQLDFLFQFVDRPQVPLYFSLYPGLEGYNWPTSVLARWQKPGDVTNVERFSSTLNNSAVVADALNSSLDYQNGSYIKLQNLSVSWQLPSSWQTRLHMRNARIYVQGHNLLTISKYQGFDPQLLSYSVLPPLRIWVAGIQTTF